MHDFFCKTAGDMLNGKLSAKVGYMKDEGGVSKMCELMQKLADKEVKEKMVSMAKKMLKEGMSESMIIKFTELSKEEVEELAKHIA